MKTHLNKQKANQLLMNGILLNFMNIPIRKVSTNKLLSFISECTLRGGGGGRSQIWRVDKVITKHAEF